MSTNIGGPTFVAGLLGSSNPLVRTSVAMFIVFAPLYLLSSMGYSWPWIIAIIVGLGFLLKQVGNPIAAGGQGAHF